MGCAFLQHPVDIALRIHLVLNVVLDVLIRKAGHSLMSVSKHREDAAGRNVLGVEGNAAVLTYPKQERHKNGALVCNLPAFLLGKQ